MACHTLFQVKLVAFNFQGLSVRVSSRALSGGHVSQRCNFLHLQLTNPISKNINFEYTSTFNFIKNVNEEAVFTPSWQFSPVL